MRVTLLTLLPLAALTACETPDPCRPLPHGQPPVWEEIGDCPTGSIAAEAADGRDATPRPRPEPEEPGEPGGHWATRDNEPDSRVDPGRHRDWQRDRDAQIEEGTW